MHTDIYGAGISNNFVAGTFPWDLRLTRSPSFCLGIGVGYTDMATEVYATDPSGNPLGLIRYSERLVSGGGAVYFPRLGYIGGTVKAYSATAPKAGVGGKDATAFGIGFDVGLLAPVWNGLWLGITASDIGGTDVRWKNTPTEPTDIVLGRYTVGTAFTRAGFTLAADYVHQPEADALVRVGGEYTIWFLSLRAGAVKRLGGALSFSAGAGIRVEGLGIDVAWLQNKEIEAEGAGNTIVMSAAFSFGGPRIPSPEVHALVTEVLPPNAVEAGCTVTVEPDQPAYNHGDVVTLTAVPATGWELVSWSDNVTVPDPDQPQVGEITIIEDTTVTASFQKKVYTLTVKALPAEAAAVDCTIAVSPEELDPEQGGYQYEQNTEVTLEAIPAEGWEFVGWSEDVTLDPANPFKGIIHVDADKTITAAFQKTVFQE
jgi:hypothetical protein